MELGPPRRTGQNPWLAARKAASPASSAGAPLPRRSGNELREERELGQLWLQRVGRRLDPRLEGSRDLECAQKGLHGRRSAGLALRRDPGGGAEIPSVPGGEDRPRLLGSAFRPGRLKPLRRAAGDHGWRVRSPGGPRPGPDGFDSAPVGEGIRSCARGRLHEERGKASVSGMSRRARPGGPGRECSLVSATPSPGAARGGDRASS
jgi:hypothetical protein